MIGGILETAGIDGFLEKLEDVYKEANSDTEAWRDFVRAWWERFRDTGIQIRDLNDLCNQQELLTVVRGDGNPRSQEIKLGFALKEAKDRVFDGLTLARIDRSPGSWWGVRRSAINGVVSDSVAGAS